MDNDTALALEKMGIFRDDKQEPRGLKEVEGKLRTDLIPPESVIELARVYTDGAKKYGDRNWEKGIPNNEAVGALERHLLRFKIGQEINPNTDTHEMAHVAFWAFAIVSQYYRNVYRPESRLIAREPEHDPITKFLES